jgi:hypothetical protein
MRHLAGLDNPTFLTPPIFWVSVTVAMLVGIAIGMSIAIGIARVSRAHPGDDTGGSRWRAGDAARTAPGAEP